MKAAKEKKRRRHTVDGLPLHSLQTLLNELATCCRNRCYIPGDTQKKTFDLLTELNAVQTRALELLGAKL